MLSIKWITDIGYYLDQCNPDYYFSPGEPPGAWWGGGAEMLGLQNAIQADHLRALCQGFSPSGTPLIQNAGAPDHQQAWDLTFSAPKPVSVLWSQVESETRSKIEALHHQAIQAALEHLSQVALFTRRGKGGLVRESVFPVVAIFPQASSRELEPQLHSHCVLLNVAGRADGTYGTILSEPFYRYKLTAGAIYQLHFAYLLQTVLGLEIEQASTSFGLVGIPKTLVNRQSTRSKQIQKKVGPKGQRSAKAAAQAALDTRKPKPERPPPRTELLRRWHEVNRSFGFTRERAQQLLGKAKPIAKLPNLPACIAQVIEELLERHAFFSEQELIRAVAKQIIGQGVPADDVIRAVRNYLSTNPDILPLAAIDHEPQYTTRQMWALEQELLTAIEQGKANISHVVSKSIVDRVLDQRLPLNKQLTQDELLRNTEQRKAADLITTKPGDIIVLEGMAGAGKTYTLSVARDALQKAGYRVVGMALSGVVARKLQADTGIESETALVRGRRRRRAGRRGRGAGGRGDRRGYNRREAAADPLPMPSCWRSARPPRGGRLAAERMHALRHPRALLRCAPGRWSTRGWSGWSTAPAIPRPGFCGSLGNLVEDARLNHRLEVVAGFLEGAQRRAAARVLRRAAARRVRSLSCESSWRGVRVA